MRQEQPQVILAQIDGQAKLNWANERSRAIDTSQWPMLKGHPLGSRLGIET